MDIFDQSRSSGLDLIPIQKTSKRLRLQPSCFKKKINRISLSLLSDRLNSSLIKFFFLVRSHCAENRIRMLSDQS
jgi:hypothetical protein